MTVLALPRWNLSIGSGQPLVVVAGLNVLEDDDLALATARHLKAVTTELGLPFVFKASFDKANRSSIKSYRGPGLKKGLATLERVKAEIDVPICTDLHEIDQADAVAAIADLVQIPAFLCRQTDLVVATARATDQAGGLLHVKKAQFMSPRQSQNIIGKVGEVVDRPIVILCERGSSFGYDQLVVDMTGIAKMKALGAPVTIDATHAVQQQGGNASGASTGGDRTSVPIIAKSAVAAGADGVFLEFHPDPDKALCDPLSCLPLDGARDLLTTLKAIHAAVN
jgi:2-dehydro-3-deoxyphosphooctonate aldolase (KDO 8-P synthase)